MVESESILEMGIKTLFDFFLINFIERSGSDSFYKIRDICYEVFLK